MKLRVPKYYNDFKCIADKCQNSCCSAGWEIDIDNKTKDYYMSIKGEFGDKLRQNISSNSHAHFILNKNKTCPFLNECGLCDIYTNLGEDKLCQICTDHPRFYEWFNGVKEAGIGLCCEEAARIILSDEGEFEVYEQDLKEKENEKVNISNIYDFGFEYKYKLFVFLFSARDNIFKYLDLSDGSIPLASKLKNILWYSHTLQQDIDFDLLDDEEIFNISVKNGSSIKSIIDYFSTLEPNNEKWPDYLNACGKLESEFNKHLQEFEDSNPDIEQYLKNISTYFIWRYFLKAVFDEDVLSKVKLMYVSVMTLRFLFFCKWFENGTLSLEDCIEIVKKFSEEVEYCENNLVKFAEDSFEEEFLETEYLLGL